MWCHENHARYCISWYPVHCSLLCRDFVNESYNMMQVLQCGVRLAVCFPAAWTFASFRFGELVLFSESTDKESLLIRRLSRHPVFVGVRPSVDFELHATISTDEVPRQCDLDSPINKRAVLVHKPDRLREYLPIMGTVYRAAPIV